MTTTTEPRELPILFKGPMVRAILEGRKSQTRRVVSPQPVYTAHDGRLAFADRHAHPHYDGKLGIRCPYGQSGDLLYVRETWGPVTDYFGLSCSQPEQVLVRYHADGVEEWRDIPACEREKANGQISQYVDKSPVPRRPSIFMPKWAARIWLRVTDVRVERVQEITDDGVIAEGVDPREPHGARKGGGQLRGDFRRLWDSINASRAPWSDDPWVWVVSFEPAEAP